MTLTVGSGNNANRVKWLEVALEKIPAGLTILDAGAGECQFKKFCTHLTYISQDFGKYDGSGEVGLQMGGGITQILISSQTLLLYHLLLILWTPLCA